MQVLTSDSILIQVRIKDTDDKKIKIKKNWKAPPRSALVSFKTGFRDSSAWRIRLQSEQRKHVQMNKPYHHQHPMECKDSFPVAVESPYA